MKTADYVLKEVKEKGIRFIRLWFTDILGQLKSFAITQAELEMAFKEGMGFDGSSIEGFARIDESDMIAKPDPSTFQLIPWMPADKPEARMFCDILNPDGTPYDGDPRYVLKRNLKELNKKGFAYILGPELEYFYFKDSQDPSILDEGTYFDLTTLDAGSDLRRDTVSTLEAMGISVELSHHEVAPSQHEIDLRYADALTMADNVMTYRMVVKEIAMQYGFYASFMPKPIADVNGSGMHVHQSLFKSGENAFFDSRDKYHLSKVAKGFIAGLLKHAAEITSVTNQWVNSYKRLVPGYEAPVYISWAQRNRSTLIRIPMYKPTKEKATRIEFRSPDPACNPYLAFSVMLVAGMEGIEKDYELPAPTEKDVYKMDEKERKKLGIESLPGSLIETVLLTEKSELVRKALGEHVFSHFIENRKIEWDQYRKHVTSYEIKKYLPIL
ncbi:glutamine synthetase [Candidatus Desantisbacteria bacterium CG1_02_38_46]|uniref:Glutamine synthetase n=3 Tax=unclassified Candidatus Desantisiibacteriota TaxID=3106372 RepID=A0A2H9P993_9BACT|nr:MAG: glutamine synthetase [Candidatus Desantisbacteria bacterium CG1_02_38_46]PIU51165.1 MAG: glutamine synthetase [Candidatus Desantisbacteria bacterium CG07_land_8_20_14_0_80_39_15]PIZ14762.1 MAG: glutamine synthetase [Candidatus Desantisbacteria bacterium CG_4_10_14_0_8_um_filter_39_17]